MRKLLCLVTLAGLALTSCQKDPAVDPKQGNGEPVTVCFTTKTPQGFGSLTRYSTADGAFNSAYGLGNVDFAASYDFRYIMEVWKEDGSQMVYRDTVAQSTPADANFSTRLVPGMYKVVFWADITTQGSTDDLHYNTGTSDGLKKVVMKGSYFGNDDAKDAYTQVVAIDLTSAGINQTITLTRPFGKVRVIATDIMLNLPQAPKKARLTYLVDVPKAYNAFDAEPRTDLLFAANTATNNMDIASDLGVAPNTATEQTLTFDYIFAPKTGQKAYNFEVQTYLGGTPITQTRGTGAKALTDIPVERNKLTTVKGNFFTYAANFTVSVDPVFGGNTLSLSGTIADLQATLTSAASTWTGDLSLHVTDAVSVATNIIIPAMPNTSNLTITFDQPNAAAVTFDGSAYTGTLIVNATSPFGGISANGMYPTAANISNQVFNGSIYTSITGTYTWSSTSANMVQTYSTNAFGRSNRFSPASISSVTFEGKEAIKVTVDPTTGTAARGGSFNTNFYNTQGKQIELVNPSTGNWELECSMYISDEMIAGAKPFYCGLWAMNSSPSIYPILSFKNVNDDNTTMTTPRWAIWDNSTGWSDAPLAPPTAAGWHTLKMAVNGSIIEYYIDDTLIGTAASNPADLPTTTIKQVALQNYNFCSVIGNVDVADPAYSFDAYFADVKYTIIP